MHLDADHRLEEPPAPDIVRVHLVLVRRRERRDLATGAQQAIDIRRLVADEQQPRDAIERVAALVHLRRTGDGALGLGDRRTHLLQRLAFVLGIARAEIADALARAALQRGLALAGHEPPQHHQRDQAQRQHLPEAHRHQRQQGQAEEHQAGQHHQQYQGHHDAAQPRFLRRVRALPVERADPREDRADAREQAFHEVQRVHGAGSSAGASAASSACAVSSAGTGSALHATSAACLSAPSAGSVCMNR